MIGSREMLVAIVVSGSWERVISVVAYPSLQQDEPWFLSVTAVIAYRWWSVLLVKARHSAQSHQRFRLYLSYYISQTQDQAESISTFYSLIDEGVDEHRSL